MRPQELERSDSGASRKAEARRLMASRFFCAYVGFSWCWRRPEFSIYLKNLARRCHFTKQILLFLTRQLYVST
jgi:hypothetical protein